MFALPKLAYPTDGLAPHLSAETLEYHYGKHHQSYVDHVNELVAGKPEAGKTLEQIILGLDFRNTRAKYVEAFLDHLANWEFALQNYVGDAALARAS